MYRNNGVKPFVTATNFGRSSRIRGPALITPNIRNKCTSIRRKAIKDHFKNKSETDNPRAFWEAYRPFMLSRSRKQANDITLIENDVVITD